jgi:hypothetical protein
MKEWQRWERMAQDFERVDDPGRAAESLSMALELLPPGHHDEKALMLERLERLRTISVERGGGRVGRGPPPRVVHGAPVGHEVAGKGDGSAAGVGGAGKAGHGHDAEAGTDGDAAGTDGDGLPAGGVVSLEPERAREAVMELARGMCSTPGGAEEAAVVARVAADLDADEEAVAGAVEDLVDEGLLFRPSGGRIMVDGVLEEADLEEAVLGTVAELSTGGRGASRKAIVDTLVARGLPREDVEEAVTDVEESGRIEDDGRGQVRSVMGASGAGEAHAQVLSAVRAGDDGKGILRGAVVRDLEGRGWEVQEVEEAIDELEEAGQIDISGNVLKAAVGAAPSEVGARERVLAVVEALAVAGGGAVHPSEVIRRAGAEGVDPKRAHEAMDDLVDAGELSRDRQGHLRVEAPAGATGVPRSAMLALVRRLQRGHQGASRAEVMASAGAEGLSEDEAEEALDGLVDDGLLHEHGGFLRPG